jgi:hypothetical protein
MKNEVPVHFYDRSYSPARIACGRSVGVGQRFSPEWQKVSCYDCARTGGALSDAQRNHIWQNANERLGKHKITPWPVPDVAVEAKAKP